MFWSVYQIVDPSLLIIQTNKILDREGEKKRRREGMEERVGGDGKGEARKGIEGTSMSFLRCLSLSVL